MSRGRRAGGGPDAAPGPQRRCVGCRRSRPQAELLRLAARGGEVVPDVRRREPGRGCYLCKDPGCAERAARGRQIGRALKGTAAEPPLERILGWMKA